MRATTTTPGLAHQLRRLLQQAGPESVPCRMLAWWGSTDFPNGTDRTPVLTQLQWEATYRLLENAALDEDTVRPLPAVMAATRDIRPDGPVPIALASFHVAVGRSQVIRAVRAAAANGNDLRFPPASLAEAIEERRVFAASALLHDQWGLTVPVHRGRDVTFAIEGTFYLTNPAGRWPDRLELDLGDGEGWRPAAFGEQFQAHYDGGSAEIAVRGHYGDTPLVARFTMPISERIAAPAPAETWELRTAAAAGQPGASGRAWVFRAGRRTEIVNPVIIVEGFPGGHPSDYLYELLDQAGTVAALHANGYDLVIVGLDNGLIPIQANAGVLVECIREARRRTRQPLVVGGLSMGGVISRYALAQMESRGEPHSTGTYLSIDAPHGGTYTTLGVQWFVHALLPFARSLGGFAGLLDSPSNQQLMIAWLQQGEVVQSELRKALIRDLAAVGGYPSQPRKIAVSCGRGDGHGGPAVAGEQTLSWAEEPFLSATLNTLPDVGDGVIAEGSWFLAEPQALEPLRFPGAPPWETAPGSQNTYNAQAAAIAEGWGCGTVHAAHPMTCCVPTVSALGLEQDAFDPVMGSVGPFDVHICSPRNVQHLELTPEVSKQIVKELGPASAPMAGGAGPGPGSTSAPAPAAAFNPSDFNPHDPRFLTDPYPVYADFRARGRSFVVSPYASRWFFHYDECAAILGDDDTFQKQAPAGTPPSPSAPPPNPTDMLREFPEGMFMADGDDHKVMRDAIETPFRHEMPAAKVTAEKYATKLLDQLKPSGHIELLADYALPVPANVLFDVIGIPDQPGVRQGLLAWETLIVPSHDITQPLQVRYLGGSTRMALLAYLQGLVHQYTENKGGPGMIGALCRPEASRLSQAQLFMSCIDFVVAGYLSTTWLVASAINSLLTQRKQWDALRADTSKVDAAVKEVLRFEPPFQLVDRYVGQDTTLGGLELRKGDKVTAVVGSANRDDTKFDKPDELDIARDLEKTRPLTFGGGIHYCIGAPLASIMAPAMLRRLMTLDGLFVDGKPQWGTDPYMRAMVNLPLRFRP